MKATYSLTISLQVQAMLDSLFKVTTAVTMRVKPSKTTLHTQYLELVELYSQILTVKDIKIVMKHPTLLHTKIPGKVSGDISILKSLWSLK